MTGLDYYWVLALAYGAAFTAWLVLLRFRPSLWPAVQAGLDLDWRELVWVVGSLVAVLGVGVLYQRGWLIPSPAGLRPLTESINQILIFSPFLLVLVARRQPVASVWIRTDRVPLRIAVGLVLAGLAMLVFTALHPDADPWPTVVARVYDPANLDLAVQVLLEDLVIAGLFVRLATTIGSKPAMVLTGVLFAAGHIPAILSGDVVLLTEIVELLRDAGLVIVALSVLRRAADVWWMWMLHYAMDMMQFHSGASGP